MPTELVFNINDMYSLIHTIPVTLGDITIIPGIDKGLVNILQKFANNVYLSFYQCLYLNAIGLSVCDHITRLNKYINKCIFIYHPLKFVEYTCKYDENTLIYIRHLFADMSTRYSIMSNKHNDFMQYISSAKQLLEMYDHMQTESITYINLYNATVLHMNQYYIKLGNLYLRKRKKITHLSIELSNF